MEFKTIRCVRTATERESNLTLEKTDEINIMKQLCESWSRCQIHDITNKEACPAYGKECKKCHKRHHFASKCWSRRPPSNQRSVRALDTEEPEEDEVFPMEVGAVELDDSQLSTLKVESGNYI